MQIIGGTVQDIELVDKQGDIGDVLSIHLSQESASAAKWTITVWVQIDQGRFILGKFQTTAPSAGNPPARTVGFAYCPGANRWYVTADCDTANDVADLVIQSSKCCSGGAAFGVTKNNTL